MGCVRGESRLQEDKNRLQNYLVALDFHKPVSGERPLRANSVEKLDFEGSLSKFQVSEVILFLGDGGPHAAHSNAAMTSVDAFMNAPLFALLVATTNTATSLAPKIGVFQQDGPISINQGRKWATATEWRW